MIESPCIGICKVIRGTNTCKGCLRTVEEISEWSSMSEDEKKLVLTRIQLRKIELNLNVPNQRVYPILKEGISNK